jgi:signal transduction histidine kinase
MITAGDRGKALVERILAFSRTGFSDRSSVNVQPVVEEVLELLVCSLGSGICLNRRLEADGAAVIGDATQLHQVVMNLCTNAIQSMQKGGVLEVLLDRTDVEQPCVLSHSDLGSGSYARLRVRDTGSGIPAHVLDRMFDPFFTTKSVTGGTGLGLSLVHGIVADLGGSIDVRTVVGCGTTFTIWLPVGSEMAAASMPHQGTIPLRIPAPARCR